VGLRFYDKPVKTWMKGQWREETIPFIAGNAYI
jgi:hypothetical protein